MITEKLKTVLKRYAETCKVSSPYIKDSETLYLFYTDNLLGEDTEIIIDSPCENEELAREKIFNYLIGYFFEP